MPRTLDRIPNTWVVYLRSGEHEPYYYTPELVVGHVPIAKHLTRRLLGLAGYDFKEDCYKLLRFRGSETPKPSHRTPLSYGEYISWNELMLLAEMSD